MMTGRIDFPAPQGWTCPRCSNVYAPFKQECSRCNNPSNAVDAEFVGRVLSLFSIDTLKKYIEKQKENNDKSEREAGTT